MKTILCTALILTICGQATFAIDKNEDTDGRSGLGPSVAGLGMSVRTATNSFRSGEAIEAFVILTNNTTNAISLPGPPFASIKLVVTDEHDKRLRQRIHLMKASEPSSLELEPHGQITYTLTLDRMFNLKSPGIYHVSAERPITTESTNIRSKIVSSRVTIAVVAAQPP
jgi:hypothetical protein